MENKLTIQEAACYLGQEVEYGAVYTRDILTVELLAEIKKYNNTYFQLILRSIEDLTSEEVEHYNMLIDILDKATTPTQEFLEFANITNYLRSIGVDCDGHIENGKAIRKQ